MNPRPDDDVPPEPPGPVSEARPTAASSADVQSVPPSSGQMLIGAIRTRSIPVPSQAVTEDHDPRSVAQVDGFGLYSTAEPVPRSGSAERSRRRMHFALEAGDYDTALGEAERLLGLEPNDGEAQATVARCRKAAELVLLAGLGGPAAVFSVEARGHLLRALERDDRTSVLVRMIRSGLTLGDILEMCGSLRVEALRVLDELVRMGVVRPG